MDEENERIECLRNATSQQHFILLEDEGKPKVTLINPEGKVCDLRRDLFQEEAFEKLLDEWEAHLTHAQLKSYFRYLEKILIPPADITDSGRSYTSTRLTFIKRVIEPLRPDQTFSVNVIGEGVFEMTKIDFEHVFDNVRKSKSYRDYGSYNYHTIPNKALRFRIREMVI